MPLVSPARESLTGFHPPCDPFACTTSSRPPHPTPTFVTIVSRTSSQGWDARRTTQISEKQKQNIFPFGTGRPDHVEPPCKIRFYAHAVFALREPLGRAGLDKIELILPVGRIDIVAWLAPPHR